MVMVMIMVMMMDKAETKDQNYDGDWNDSIRDGYDDR